MIKCKAVISMVVIALLSLGCATLKKGPREPVWIESEPSGAEVWINGRLRGPTPFLQDLLSARTYLFEVKLKNCGVASFVISGHLGGSYVAFDLFSGVWPCIVDGATGSWYVLDATGAYITFHCESGERPDVLIRPRSPRAKRAPFVP
ncbi:PEGA domain-containing protein [bacterium]|nr:PEGA domain-containing protein [bacterium]